MEQRRLGLLARWLGKPGAMRVFDGTHQERSTAPNAPASLFLRIHTVDGPRTLIASGITVATASLISKAMTRAGHYAEFVDQCSAGATVRRAQGALDIGTTAKAA